MITLKKIIYNKKIIGPIIAGIILTLLGAGLIYLVPGKEAKAVDIGSYTQNWKATKSLQAALAPQGIRIPFGVAEWTVTGSMTDNSSGTTYYKETWQVPHLDQIDNRVMPAVNLWADGSWLWGFTGYVSGYTDGNGGANMLSFTALNDFTSIQGTPGDGSFMQGKAVACGTGPGGSGTFDGGGQSDCLLSLGAYGIEYWHKIASAGEGKMPVGGLVMPLQWNISGKICSDSADTNCK